MQTMLMRYRKILINSDRFSRIFILSTMRDSQFTFILYGIDRSGDYYILKKSTKTYSSFTEAATAANKPKNQDICDSHGGPYLLVMEKSDRKDEDEHMRGIGKMLSDASRGCDVQ